MQGLSPYLLSILAGWVIAQGLKYVFAVLKSRDLIGNVRQLYLSGNMPSAHTATVVALATVIGLKDGVDSALFALAALFAAIVMYDAMMVRRSSGEQGLALQQLIGELKSKVLLPRAAKGHTPLEVVTGLVIGVIIGIVVFIATK
ncbi:MAG TPA: divergent PAP2 family protein [Candidatus Saccharibacteria bacterium]|nr:divergent PAP2 family protein [Candidatus Saccharibacteria bacterium]